jgi:integrase
MPGWDLLPSCRQWEVANLSRTYSRLRDQAGPPKSGEAAQRKPFSPLNSRPSTLYSPSANRGKGIEYARRLLGHSDISTTQRYMHLDERELAEAQDLVE